MNAIVATLTCFTLGPSLDLTTAAWQLVPLVEGELRAPKVTKQKCVLCIPGLYPHPIQPSKATKPEMHPWFEPKAALHTALATDFDVYGFGYAQTVPLDGVASSVGLFNTVAKLRAAGYKEIVLIGHSAGGLVAQQFAERYPNSGVTKVIPVAAPYLGSDIAEMNFGLPKTQIAYIKSIAPQPRQETLTWSGAFPKNIEICCVCCKIPGLSHDILVGLESQWPPAIRKQGIPATLVAVNHFDAIKSPHAVGAVADLAKSKLTPSWSEAEVTKATNILFGADADDAAVASSRKDRPLLRKAGGLLERVIGDRVTTPKP